MEISYTPMDLLLYLLLYSFIAWGIEVCIVAVRDRRFVNRGFLNLPVNLPYGIAAALLLPALATLKNVFLEYGMIWVVLCLVQALSNQFLKGISRKYASADYCSGTASGRNGIPLRFLVAGVYLLFYLIVHPLVFSLVTLMPALVVRIVVIAAAVLVGIDFFSVLYTLRTNRSTPMEEARQETTQYLARRMSDTIWRRLQKAYPGIGEENTQEGNYVFAKGICFDKMVWVFLVSSFLGALIEMAFCRLLDEPFQRTVRRFQLRVGPWCGCSHRDTPTHCPQAGPIHFPGRFHYRWCLRIPVQCLYRTGFRHRILGLQ